MQTEPVRINPSEDWVHFELYNNVREAIFALPAYFKTETSISGINATDIFTLNQTLGATIEEQVVNTLNQMRQIWDPKEKYQLYGFIRQPQTFPDVLLRKYGKNDVIMGVELKGWYLIAKEGEPSFRYTVTPAACNPQDILVVVPWSLSNIISGAPKVFTPFVEHARYAAEYRNYHWEHLRKAKTNTKIIHPEKVNPYPNKADRIQDEPVSDSGRNFGRIARTGIMDDYISSSLSQYLCGIEAKYWLGFFKIFQEHSTSEKIQEELGKLEDRINLIEKKDDLIEKGKNRFGGIGTYRFS